jgi:hypothetical protein
LPGVYSITANALLHLPCCRICLQVCCVPLAVATCSDYDVVSPDAQIWPCKGLTAFNTANTSYSPPSNAACCLVSKQGGERSILAHHQPALQHDRACNPMIIQIWSTLHTWNTVSV